MVDGIKDKISTFEDLRVWQDAQLVAVAVYQLVKRFPIDEKYGLCDQLRRSSSSVSANIAEGFGRRSPKDKVHFYVIAYGSLLETKSHLYLAQKLSYVNTDDIEELLGAIVINQKQLNAFMASIKQ